MPLFRTWKTTWGYLIRLKYFRHSPFGLKQLTVRNRIWNVHKTVFGQLRELTNGIIKATTDLVVGRRVTTGQLFDQAREEYASGVPVSVKVDKDVLIELYGIGGKVSLSFRSRCQAIYTGLTNSMVQVSETPIVDVDQVTVTRVQIGHGRVLENEGRSEARIKGAMKRNLVDMVGKERLNALEERGLIGKQEPGETT